MSRVRIAVSVESGVVAEIDKLIATGVFSSRSEVFDIAVRGRLRQLRQSRLRREVRKFDPAEEQALANE
jgi:metal-responsive CopG/Arc/MetJ family transcriptional regulator